MTIWLTPNKEFSYASLRGQFNKETKKTDPWNNHVSVDEMFWQESDGFFTVLSMANSVAGYAVSNAAKDKVKFPMPIKIQFKTEGASNGELCLMKCLKAKTESGKRYTGFFSINDENPFAAAIASGLKGDGTPLTDAELGNFAGQFVGLMETQTALLSDEIIATMLKIESYGNGKGYAKAETKAEKIAVCEAKMKEYLGVKPEATFQELADEFYVLSESRPSTVDLINLLLR